MTDATRLSALQQSIADLEHIAAYPGNILVLLERRKAEEREIREKIQAPTILCAVCGLVIVKSEKSLEWLHADTGTTTGYARRPHHAMPEEQRPQTDRDRHRTQGYKTRREEQA